MNYSYRYQEGNSEKLIFTEKIRRKINVWRTKNNRVFLSFEFKPWNYIELTDDAIDPHCYDWTMAKEESFMLQQVYTSKSRSLDCIDIPFSKLLKFLMSGIIELKDTDTLDKPFDTMPKCYYEFLLKKVSKLRKYTPQDMLEKIEKFYDFLWDDFDLILGQFPTGKDEEEIKEKKWIATKMFVVDPEPEQLYSRIEKVLPNEFMGESDVTLVKKILVDNKYIKLFLKEGKITNIVTNIKETKEVDVDEKTKKQIVEYVKQHGFFSDDKDIYYYYISASRRVVFTSDGRLLIELI